MFELNKLNGFIEHLAEGEHNLGSDQLKVALSNTAPGSESAPPTGATADCILANVTEVDYTYASSRNVTTSASAQTGGTYKLTLQDLTISASGGAVGPFRYIYLYNDTASGKKLIGYYDYGETITLNDGDSTTLNFDDAEGVLTLN